MKFFIFTLLLFNSPNPSQPSTHQNSHSPSTQQQQTQNTLSENSKNETKSNAVSPTTRQINSRANPSPSTSERNINQELKQRKQTKSRQLNAQNLTEGELEYQRVTTNIVSELEKLPQICQQNSSLKEKTIQFQNKLKMIKEQVLLSQDLRLENLIHFEHLINIFSTSEYITFLYEEDIEFNFEIPEKEEDLREHLIFLSEQLKHKYRYYFKTTDTSIENLPTWNRYIISTLDCFVR